MTKLELSSMLYSTVILIGGMKQLHQLNAAWVLSILSRVTKLLQMSSFCAPILLFSRDEERDRVEQHQLRVNTEYSLLTLVQRLDEEY